MMASLLDVAVRRAGEGGFDKPVAALAAAAAGALLFLMPSGALHDLVTASGLPGILPPAEPPLGMKARALFAVAAAILAFAATYCVMRLLGRAPARPAPRAVFEPEPVHSPPPRMRRRDLHPDAPVRAPLSALRDLGLPAAQEEMAIPHLEEEEEEEEELILTELEVAQDVVPQALPPEPAPLRHPQPSAPPRPQGEETIAELLARLERALENKPLPTRAEPARPAAPTAAETPAEPQVEPMDARLRSALENLKRFAPGHA